MSDETKDSWDNFTVDLNDIVDKDETNPANPTELSEDTLSDAFEIDENGADDTSTDGNNASPEQKADTEKEENADCAEDDGSSDVSEDDSDSDEELLKELSLALEQQVKEEIDTNTNNEDKGNAEDMNGKAKAKSKKIALVTGSVVLSILIILLLIFGTRPGRKIVYWVVGKYIDYHTGSEENKGNTLTPGDGQQNNNPDSPNNQTPGEGVGDEKDPTDSSDNTPITIPETYTVRKEEYVRNYLIFGIEQIDGAQNTDTMMIASVNTKDKTIKLTSILRDTYVELADGKGRKLNSVYARGRRDGQGPELLIATLEQYFKIDIEGYAYVNFDSFEKIVDILGGVTIELGKSEAAYLNKTNYISNPAYRNVQPGINHLNGNQVVGYCRIRKVVTLGGYENDYGRTIRQRRVLTAIFDAYKSKGITELLPITEKCLSYVKTDANATQISELLEMVIENKITTIQTDRIPVSGSFYDSGKAGYNGVTYGLVINDMEKNIKFLYEFLYADTPEEAEEHYNQLQK